MHLTKHHGLGNDFLILLEEASGTLLGASGSDLARRLCDRHTGLGADGLIYGEEEGQAEFDVGFRLWNADGGEAQVSGNGLRCLAQALALHRGETAASYRILLNFEPGWTDVRTADVRPGPNPITADVSVDMGPVTAGPSIPADLELSGKAASASIGNPHLVVLVDDPTAVDLPTVGPAIESNFAQGINVEFIAAADPSTLDLVVWERGSGITQACGSGACAAAHVAHGWGLVGEQVRVRMPGGTAEVTLGEGGVRLTGPSTFVARIEVPDA